MDKDEIAAAQAKLDAQKTALDARDSAFSEREQRLADAETRARHTGCTDFVEGLVHEGRVLPAQKDGLIEFMAGLDDAGTVEFGEGKDAVKQTPVEFLKGYLSAQPKAIAFGEHAGAAADELDLTDPQALASAAVEFQESEQASGRTISMTEAVDHIKQTGAAE